MKSRIKRLRVGPLVCPVLLLGTMPQHVAAAVLETNASLAIRVQELIDDAPASFSENDATFPAIGVDLPLTASARVESTDLDGTLVAVGQGFAEFADPVLLAQDNPEELALEVACYSNADNVTYQVHGMATETRTVVFTDARSDLAPPEIQFRLDGTREIESRIFLSGAVLVWTPNLDTDGDGFPNNTLDGLSVDVRLNVLRLVDAADSAPTLLFDTTISRMGAGDTLPAPETTGPIVFELSTVDELVAEGLDDASANALRAVADAGSLTILLIRAQEHAYRYQVRANESLLLRAELSVEIKNISGGSGIAVAIGRPFSELTDFIEHAIDGAMPIPVQQSINAALAGRDVGFVPSGAGGRGALCGALGIEVVPFALALGLCPRRRRRRACGARYPRADAGVALTMSHRSIDGFSCVAWSSEASPCHVAMNVPAPSSARYDGRLVRAPRIVDLPSPTHSLTPSTSGGRMTAPSDRPSGECPIAWQRQVCAPALPACCLQPDTDCVLPGG